MWAIFFEKEDNPSDSLYFGGWEDKDEAKKVMDEVDGMVEVIATSDSYVDIRLVWINPKEMLLNG